MKKIIAISGSTRANSSNETILRSLPFDSTLFQIEFFLSIDQIPHFNPDIDEKNIPLEVQHLRDKVAEADGVVFCTPEYVFSLPGTLKNAIEWFVSTTIFTDKPVGFIIASASGKYAFDSLGLILKTIQANLTADTQLLISGAKGKVDLQGQIIDKDLKRHLFDFTSAFSKRL